MLLAEASKRLKGIFERSWMKAGNYRKEKKNAKQKVKMFRKKTNNAGKLENLVESHLLKFQKT